MLRQLLVLMFLGVAGAATAGEVYLNFGLPGVGIGYAQPLSPSLTLRGDYSTLGKHRSSEVEEGIDYDGSAQIGRAGLFADWFVLGGLRLTGGLTFNTVKLDLRATGSGGTIEIGDTTYTMTADDRFEVRIKYPSTTPYVGIGYGHQMSTGLGFVFDLGASIGTAKLTARASGPNLDAVSQDDIDAETAELRDGVGKFKFLPQISLGLNYRF